MENLLLLQLLLNERTLTYYTVALARLTARVQEQMIDSQAFLFESLKLFLQKKIKWIDLRQPVKEHPTVIVNL